VLEPSHLVGPRSAAVLDRARREPALVERAVAELERRGGLARELPRVAEQVVQQRLHHPAVALDGEAGLDPPAHAPLRLGAGQFGLLIWLLNTGLATVPSGRAALIFSLEPVVAAVTSWVVAGEVLSPRAAAGAMNRAPTRRLVVRNDGRHLTQVAPPPARGSIIGRLFEEESP